MEYILAFDVGGTFIKYGLIDRSNNIVIRDELASPTYNCREKIPLLLADISKELKAGYKIAMIGVSTAGNLDKEEGRVIYSADLEDYSGAEIGRILSEETGLANFIENDVNAAAIGEYRLGAARGRENFVCLTIGTGIGAAIFINGKLYEGSHGLAGELGHMIIDRGGRQCKCGNLGCYESYASTRSLLEEYRRISGEKYAIDGLELMDRLMAGEELALELFDKFLDDIALGLANISHILDPELIVIGGGISESADLFFPRLREKYRELCMPSYRDLIQIEAAELGNDAALLGIAYEGFKKLDGGR